jgi:hypothetical protein
LSIGNGVPQANGGWSLAGNDTINLEELKQWRFVGNFTIGTPSVQGTYCVLNDNVNSYLLATNVVGITRPAIYQPSNSSTYVAGDPHTSVTTIQQYSVKSNQAVDTLCLFANNATDLLCMPN